MKHIRSALAGLLALFVASAALAQTFPTVPAQSVIGRLGTPGVSGPSSAIPFATVLSNLGGSQTANKVWAGPTSGGAAAPTFRLLVGGDIPPINLAAGNVNGGVTGATPIANGGTGATAKQAGFDNLAPTATRAGDVAYWNGTHWVTLAGNNSGTKILTEDGSGVPSWAATGSVSSVTCGTGLSGGAITTTGTCAVNYAVKADQQTGTSTILAVNPAVQQNHDSAEKAWVSISSCSAGTCTILASYNVTSVVFNSTGNYTVTFTTAFATTAYVCNTALNGNAAGAYIAKLGTKATGTIVVLTFGSSFTAINTDFDLTCRGRQ